MDESEIIRKALREQKDLDPALRKMLEEKLTPKPLSVEDDDEMLILCGYWPSIINGSKMVLCQRCKTRCCIAPSTQQNLKGYTGKVLMLCLQCFQDDPPAGAPELPKGFVFPPKPGAKPKLKIT